jgi:hypothetical protein
MISLVQLLHTTNISLNTSIQVNIKVMDNMYILNLMIYIIKHIHTISAHNKSEFTWIYRIQ